MALLGKLFADKYRIDEMIGESSFGALYRGSNTLLDKPVAIAVPQSEDHEAFFTQARAAAKISHPNVVSLTDFGTDADGSAYAIYESAPGETLADALRREGRLPPEMAIDITRQTGAALSAAHAGGLVHGDLSPANIIVSSVEPGRVAVKLFGFGSANALHDNSTDRERFAYLAPEQCSGAENADNRGDVYSLGAILYESLAGAKPFTGDTASHVMMRQIDEPPPPLSSFRTDLPAWIEPVILKAMAKNPDARYQTVDHFVNDLSSAGVIPATAASGGEPQNNLWKTAFVVLAGISLLTAVMIFLTYSPQTDPTTALQPDANGMPVQPINPATGVEEQNLSSLPPDFSYDANSNSGLPPGTLPGDSGNPWLTGNNPPPGGPPVGSGGQVIPVPLGQSPFAPPEGCLNPVWDPQRYGWLCDFPTNQPARPTPTPRTPANTNTNTGTPPAATPPPQPVRPSPTPARTPNPPAANRPDPNREQLRLER